MEVPRLRLRRRANPEMIRQDGAVRAHFDLAALDLFLFVRFWRRAAWYHAGMDEAHSWLLPVLASIVHRSAGDLYR